MQSVQLGCQPFIRLKAVFLILSNAGQCSAYQDNKAVIIDT